MLYQYYARDTSAKQRAPSSALGFLRESKLFAGIPDEVVEECAARFTVLHVNRGGHVFQQGEPCAQIHCAIRGLVRVGQLTEDGEDFTVRIVGRGDIFGDESLSGKSVHSVFATPLEDAIIGVCRADCIKALIMRYPVLGFTVAKCLRERHDRALNRIQRMKFNRAGDHLLTVLHELAAECAATEKQATRIELPLTHAQLASIIGTTRETVSYELGKLARKGLVIPRNRKVVVPLPAGGASVGRAAIKTIGK